MLRANGGNENCNLDAGMMQHQQQESGKPVSFAPPSKLNNDLIATEKEFERTDPTCS